MKLKQMMIWAVCLIVVFSVSEEASASVNKVTVLVNKNGSTVNLFIKNTDNKLKSTASLELFKDGKKIKNLGTVSLNKNQQIKKSIKVTSKGKYKVKYTVKGKSGYTSIFSH